LPCLVARSGGHFCAVKAADVASVLSVVAGRDPCDATSADVPVPDYQAALTEEIRGLRIGFPRALFGKGLDAEVAAASSAQLMIIESSRRNC